GLAAGTRLAASRSYADRFDPGAGMSCGTAREQVPMTLAPLLNAAPAIQLHVAAAFGIIVLGAVQFSAPKGTIPHPAVGWTWVAMMAVMLVSGFFIHDILQSGPFSPKLCQVAGKSLPWMTRCGAIHVVTLGMLLALPYAVLHARRGNVQHHRRAMLMLLV